MIVPAMENGFRWTIDMLHGADVDVAADGDVVAAIDAGVVFVAALSCCCLLHA